MSFISNGTTDDSKEDTFSAYRLSTTNNMIIEYGKEIEKMAIELSKQDKPLDVRRTLAASFHELLLIKKDFSSLKRLDKLLDTLINDSYLKESGIQTVLTKNLALIVENYFKNLDIQQFVKQIFLQKDKEE